MGAQKVFPVKSGRKGEAIIMDPVGEKGKAGRKDPMSVFVCVSVCGQNCVGPPKIEDFPQTSKSDVGWCSE